MTSPPYTIRKVPRPSHTKRRRIHTPSLFIIHATRGHTTLNLQDDATLNWFQQSPDRGGWGSTADVLISSDDDFIYEFGDIMREHSTWSAGYGALGPSYEYGADEWGISIELAQTDQQEPFTAKVIDKLVWYVQTRSRDFRLAIPPIHVTDWNQRRTGAVPSGFIGHDETANGRKTKKSDPGKQFPWDSFLARVKGETVTPRFTGTDYANLTSLLFLGNKYPDGGQGTVTIKYEKSVSSGSQVTDTFTITRARKV